MNTNNKPFYIPTINNPNRGKKTNAHDKQHVTREYRADEFVSPFLGVQANKVAEVHDDPVLNKAMKQKYHSYQDDKPRTVEEIKTKYADEYRNYGVRSSAEYTSILKGEYQDPRQLQTQKWQQITNQEVKKPKVEEEVFEEVIIDSQPEKTWTEYEVRKPIKEEPQAVKNHNVRKMVQRSTTTYSGFPLDLLHQAVTTTHVSEEWANKQKQIIDDVFQEFGYGARVARIICGPTVTQFLIAIDPGVDVSKINSYNKTLQMKLSVVAVRIQDPIPGMEYAGIEIPNSVKGKVYLGNMINNEEYLNHEAKLYIPIGVDIAGNNVYYDISKMPHGLIAGSTGSGKSVCIHAVIISLLSRLSPDELRLILIDPKKVELSSYMDIPHLALPVVTDPLKACAALNWCVKEMERRFALFQNRHTRSVENYNNLAVSDGLPRLPYVVVIIDELADLMSTTGADVENSIKRITALGRAAGIHILVATQRPSTDVIRGSIKNNIPTRFAFKVSSTVDSITIIDHSGAEKLLKNGDMLLVDEACERRIQGAYVDEEEINRVTAFLRDHYQTEYIIDEVELEKKRLADEENVELDDQFEEIARYIVDIQDASANNISRRFHRSFNLVSEMLDIMAEYGIVSAAVKGKAREVLVSPEELDAILQNIYEAKGLS